MVELIAVNVAELELVMFAVLPVLIVSVDELNVKVADEPVFESVQFCVSRLTFEPESTIKEAVLFKLLLLFRVGPIPIVVPLP